MTGLMGRLVCLLMAGVVSLVAADAGKTAGWPGLAGSLALAGSVIADPAAALTAADRLLEEAAVPAAQTQIEDWESPPLFEPPPTETPVPTQPPATPEPPPPPGMGLLKESHYGQGSGECYLPLPAGTIKNCTRLPAAEVAEAAAQGLPFTIEKNSDQPQVLIMHTHTTESYEPGGRSWFDPAYTSRSTDGSIGVVAVGQQIAAQLNAAGVNTIQDTTLHDYPSYNGSYARSNQTVRGLLERYPTIKIVLDVHRDAIESDGRRVAAVAEVDGRQAAQVMVICGADKGGNLPRFKQNLAFAAAWESAMEGRYPGLTRPVLFDYRYYNQDLTTGSLLIEVGSHGNTVEQAVYAGELVGRALAALLTE